MLFNRAVYQLKKRRAEVFLCFCLPLLYFHLKGVDHYDRVIEYCTADFSTGAVHCV